MSIRPTIRILSDEDVHSIYGSSLKILEDTGIKLMAPEAVELLSAHGCSVDGDRVRIPPEVVEKAVESTPSVFTLYDRRGEQGFEVGGMSVRFGTGPTTPNTLDFTTGKRRPTTVRDVEDAARVCDALDNIDWIMPLGSAQDVPAKVADVHEFEATVTNTTKPIAFICSDAQGIRDVVAMAAAARGTGPSLTERPFVLAFPEPICPLVHPKDAVEQILVAAELGIPLAYYPSPMSGATAPVTMAGMLALATADALTGLVVAQLKSPGTPVVLGFAANIMDMATGNLCHGFAEMSLAVAAHGEIMRAKRIPSWGIAGLSDSKIVDEQAAVESAFSCLMNGLAGLNMVHDVGYMEMGMSGSVEMVVLSNEVIGMVRRVLAGIDVSEETIALDLVRKIGPGGNFLAEEHTVRHFREEIWPLSLMDRNGRDSWEADGALSLSQRVNRRSRELLKAHVPAEIGEDAKREISEIRKASVASRR
jgi:trimethylamine--corrinoid protein Co-methyltransferase